MKGNTNATRRDVLRTGATLCATGVGLGAIGTAAANPGRGDEQGNGKSFGRVYANDELWRTNVVRVLDDRPDPEDKLYFLHDENGPIVANPDARDDQLSPFVSESAPGDRDWNGGKWTTFSALVTDVEKFNDEDAPLTNAGDVLDADYIDVTMGNPGFGPPDYFICPLNGRA